jgi:hypothetical protein
VGDDVSRKLYRCHRVRQNNGIVEVFLKRDADGQEEVVIYNIIAEPSAYEEGKMYWCDDPEPAFPH